MNRLLQRLARDTQASFSRTLPLCLPKRLMYAVNHCYPFSSNGYAVRTHRVATELVRAGIQVVAASRPGMPWDRQEIKTKEFAYSHNIDGVRYLHRPTPSARAGTLENYLTACVDAWAEVIQVFKPSAVMAASNWHTALPAAIAAHELGMPFFYDVRGFWEISRAAREPQWSGSLEYQQAVDCETLVARCAHKVFTLNRFMQDELIHRGIEAERIELVPNGFPGWQITPASHLSRQTEGIKTRYVVGYVGSFNTYEGLELLIEALALLHKRDINVALLLVGSSEPNGLRGGQNFVCSATQGYQKLAHKLGVADYLFMPGRVSPEVANAYYALLDVVVIARRPFPVCELVSPLKPLEAAAHGKQVLMSDVAPLADLAGICSSFHYFAKGNAQALADKLAELLAAGNFSPPRDPGLDALCWEHTVQPMVRAIQALATKEILQNRPD